MMIDRETQYFEKITDGICVTTKTVYIINPDKSIVSVTSFSLQLSTYSTIITQPADPILHADILLSCKEINRRKAFELIYSVIKCFEPMSTTVDHPHPPDA